LIVDDEADTREFLENFLQSEGYTVRCARTAGEAFLKLAEFMPDLILLDIMLPGLDGLKAAEALRDDPYTTGIPIVHITARKDAAARARAAEMGLPLLEKPFTCAQLQEMIAKAMGPPELAEGA
jgi:CheY-like chemotaxis protein